jgi:tripartite-type tricarboxylate transporter receptor subunit TctC
MDHTTMRSDALPDAPSIADFLPGYEVSAFYGLNAPKGTPPEIIGMLNEAVNDALADPEMKKKFADLGGMMLGGSPAEFGKFLVAETDKWAKVVTPSARNCPLWIKPIEPGRLSKAACTRPLKRSA